MTCQVPDSIVERIRYVARYIEDSSSDWFQVKKEILVNLRPRDRSFFSKRHKTSKKHFISPVELEVISLWKTITGIELQVDADRLHKPEDERPPRYSALMELNRLKIEKARLKHENKE